jgi:peptidoglycan/xylan/chitin deacetylase (PgdA/CDA1 family)
MLKLLFGAFSPAGVRGKLSVLIFHRVLPEPDVLFPDEMDARRFDEACRWLRSWFNVLALDDAVARLKSGALPARAACITFDDGYADNHDVALPILLKHGLSATFFIATGFLDGGRMWNDTVIESIRCCELGHLDLGALGVHPVRTRDEKVAAIEAVIGKIKYLSIEDRLTAASHVATIAGVRPPDNLMMTSAQVVAMRHAGMQIGAHTQSHPILARMTDAQARAEVKGSKLFLEQLLGERIGLFAYPNGKPGEDYSPQTVAVVRELDFDAAVSTQWGTSSQNDDMLQIRRFTPWDRSRLRFAARLIANLRRN